MYFDGPQQVNSIKCHYPPGGQSNFKFLHDNPQPDACHYKKFPDSKAGYNILNLQGSNENDMGAANIRNCSIKTDYQVGKEKVNIFKGQYNYDYIQPSIKVTQNPGGNSHVMYAGNQ